MPWTCQHCQSQTDDELAICWQCGAGKSGEPAAPDWRPEWREPFDGSERKLDCLRCGNRMAFAGLRYVQDGSYLKEVIVGEFFMERLRLQMYQCETCDKVEFFAAQSYRIDKAKE